MLKKNEEMTNTTETKGKGVPKRKYLIQTKEMRWMREAGRKHTLQFCSHMHEPDNPH